MITIVIGALGMVPKCLVRELEELKAEDESRPSKLQHFQEQPEYWEEFKRSEETCYHSDYN